MKKSTLIVLAVAIALGAFVYFYDSKHAPKTTSAEETPKPAFAAKPAALTSITLERKGETVVLSKNGAKWQLTKPVETAADQGTVGGIVTDLTDLNVQRSFSAADDLSKYGLAKPASKIEFQDAKGVQHVIQLGDKDFSGDAVYAMVGNAKPAKVDLLPVSILDDSNKSMNDLRDRSLVELNSSDVTALNINDSSGDIKLKKATAGWEITKPRDTLADSSAVDGLISSLSSSKFTDVVSETATDLAKYGLKRPSVTLDIAGQNGKRFQLLLSKKGSDYYGRDTQRPMIYKVDSATYDAFNKKFFDLRDKEVLHFDPTNVATVEVQNANGLIQCAQKKDDQWTMLQPAANEGKPVQGWKLTDPIENARATQIYDAPSAAILAHLKKPAIQVVLTDKSGKATTIQISAAVGKSVYVRTSASPQVYELNTQILTDLGFKPADLLV